MPHTKQYNLFLFLIILGGITFGYNISAIASALPKLQKEFQLSVASTSLIAGLVFAGMAGAKLTMSIFNDLLGRRKTLIIAAIIFCSGSLLIIIAPTVRYIILGRLLQGIGGGLLMFTTSLYIVELANDKTRGKLTALYQLSFTIGLLMANLIGMFIFDINWRITFAILVALSLIFILIIYQLPCSPRWLLRQNKVIASLAALRINHTEEEANNIIKSWQDSKIMQQSANIFQLKYLKALTLIIIITCLNQFTGINAILQTSTILFKNTGFSNHAALLVSVGITAVNVLGTIIGTFIIDKFARNKLLGSCGIIIAIAHLIIAVNFFSGINSSIILIAGLLIFILSFAIGPGIIIWLVFSEYLPLPVRSQGIAIAGFINAVAGFCISSLFIYLSTTFGFSWMFLICFCFSLVYGLIPLYYLPNTNGKDIEKFDELFSYKKPIQITK